ncbi:50S ribosomal protein L6 [Candidatus Falkowbacteria bacterium CG_4_9_14_3_um_filter_38_19]|uniref:Large ribosomal subunit protein uL6 n=2 Tax=Candidatus Falkowiibacteriota TaxID=1752728 RepID=A0A2M6WRE8_9BACT|nr:50S ribosomal protein L6 [Candidatus Falkowbacteria bacterium]PIT95296.1 MAG: 50S ribosomal protein L6 [Candidatus Falkowbacteria bacterium CG10_big_fil_rev_8_21_14_0_10_38_22]PJB16028.1 MAG: 50S ribosomal protein L6 [Candidatus Falkowbacteria bacterium CG_4_9_14_3_um_filter_38_19]
MSRLGKMPIELTKGTQAKVEGDFLVIKGPKGELREKIHQLINIAITDQEIKVMPRGEGKQQRALWGLWRSLIKNMVIGVTIGYQKKLEINGIGFKAAVSGNKLTLNVGFSHPVIYELPAGVTAKIEANTIILSGFDKQLVGEVAAQIRKIKKPEPYKGKGIKYSDEVIRRKAGKTAVKA